MNANINIKAVPDTSLTYCTCKECGREFTFVNSWGFDHSTRLGRCCNGLSKRINRDLGLTEDEVQAFINRQAALSV